MALLNYQCTIGGVVEQVYANDIIDAVEKSMICHYERNDDDSAQIVSVLPPHRKYKRTFLVQLTLTPSCTTTEIQDD